MTRDFYIPKEMLDRLIKDDVSELHIVALPNFIYTEKITITIGEENGEGKESRST